jgi:iron complex transport system substrate-binding protein
MALPTRHTGQTRHIRAAAVLRLFAAPVLCLAACMAATPVSLHAQTRTVTDMAGREVCIPEDVETVICSGSGCLRLLTYLGAQDRVVAVDTAETRGIPVAVDIRAYAMANPEFRTYPVFGDFRGMDNPELILGLEQQPQVILKIEGGYDYRRLEERTGIPVVVLGYGNLTHDRDVLDRSLRLMAEVVGEPERAEEVIAFFDELTGDLRNRGQHGRARYTDQRKSEPTVYIGGIAMRGGHGFSSTEPSYTPFVLLGARNVAEVEGRVVSHAVVAKEQILVWNPEYVFLDLGITGPGADTAESRPDVLDEIAGDPVYQGLSAVQQGRVYGVLPYNSYTRNFDTVLANSYYIGKVLYPDAFSDIDPRDKADEIYSFLTGIPMMDRIDSILPGQVFKPLSLE